jgi:uroporphyrinogen III methyltransferase / synthase
VSFSEPPDKSDLDRAIRALSEFDWILFTSANAARFFAGRCRKLGIEPGQGGRYRCAAVGPATAGAVAAEGFAVDHVAQEFTGAALAAELSSMVAGRKVLLPRSERARRDLPDALKAAGAEVADVVAYHTGGVGVVNPEVLRAMREGNVDVVSFFSPSAIENMRADLGEESFGCLGARVAFAAVGPITAAALRNVGLPVAIEAPLATAESMADAIANYFSVLAGSKVRTV